MDDANLVELPVHHVGSDLSALLKQLVLLRDGGGFGGFVLPEKVQGDQLDVCQERVPHPIWVVIASQPLPVNIFCPFLNTFDKVFPILLDSV